MIGSRPIGLIENVVISAVSHEGLSVTVNGQPAQLAIVTNEGQVIACGKNVAREVEGVSINSYREFLKGNGFLRVYGNSLSPK